MFQLIFEDNQQKKLIFTKNINFRENKINFDTSQKFSTTKITKLILKFLTIFKFLLN